VSVLATDDSDWWIYFPEVLYSSTPRMTREAALLRS
jgi:predicted RNase H-like HicB family nuclease